MKLLISAVTVALLFGSADAFACHYCNDVLQTCPLGPTATACDFSSGACVEVNPDTCGVAAPSGTMPLASEWTILSVRRLDHQKNDAGVAKHTIKVAQLTRRNSSIH
jgi:hypothetical protein